MDEPILGVGVFIIRSLRESNTYEWAMSKGVRDE